MLTLRKQINAGQVKFVDAPLDGAQMVRYGFRGR
jgi:hypothetical protein